MKLTAFPTLPISQNASIFAEPKVIAESGPFMMIFVVSAATGETSWGDQIAHTIVVLFSLMSPPVMYSQMNTNLAAIETCHLILCCRIIFN